MYRSPVTCPTCRAINTLTQIGTAPSGASVFRCTYCGHDAVYHTSRFHMQTWWLPVLETEVSVACPTCGLVEQVAKTVAQSQSAPPSVREIAQGIAFSALVVGTVFLLAGVVKAVEEAA